MDSGDHRAIFIKYEIFNLHDFEVLLQLLLKMHPIEKEGNV